MNAHSNVENIDVERLMGKESINPDKHNSEDGIDCTGLEHGHDHQHVKGWHDHNHDTDEEEEDRCGHDHGHDHEHVRQHEKEEDCCGHDHDHDHHGAIDKSYEKCCDDEHDIETGPVALHQTAISKDTGKTCSLCDPTSPNEHTIVVTRFRVANLCCSGEERLIRTALEGRKGIDHIAVNIIGRYAVLKHCPMECCASSDYVCQTLNALALGVSVQEVGSGDSDEDLPSFDALTVAHVASTAALFLVGLILSLNSPTKSVSLWVYIASIVIGILPILRAACLACFVRGVLDINTLIVVAVAGALASGEYFDGSLLVTLFIAAELLESTAFLYVQKAVNSTSRNSTPKTAYLASGKSLKVEDIKVNDVLAVRTGEMILCDGVVAKGEGVINESSLTGEAKPVEKKTGSTVMSGTVVINGYLEVTVQKTNKESTIKLLEQAVLDVQAEKGFFSGIVDQFSVCWTPLILFVSIAVVLIGGGVTGDWKAYVQRGLVILVLACPCAFAIAAPIPGIAAIAIAARSGVLIKGSAVIERLSTISCVTVDKTGTLTKGYFKVCDRMDLRDVEKNELRSVDVMMLAAALEQKSTHPLANAVISEVTGCVAEAVGITFPEVRRVKVLDGVGIEGQVLCDGIWLYIAVANERILSRTGSTVKTTSTKLQSVKDFKVRSAGKAVLMVVVGDELCLLMSLADEIRVEAHTFVSSMRSLNLKIKMLTGDQKDVAEAVCTEVGLAVEDCHASLMPNDKYTIVSTLEKEKKERVMMIGDGVNDSTALASASVGVAMGAAGSALAVVNADLVLMNDNLLLLPRIIQLSRSVRAVILENVTLAIGVKIMAIVLAVMGLISFWQAIVIDIGTLAVVLVNGIRFLWSDLLIVDDAVNVQPSNKISSFPMELDV